MSSTPIYDELAAILLSDHSGTADAAGRPQPEKPDDASKQQVRTGGRRRKPEPDA